MVQIVKIVKCLVAYNFANQKTKGIFYVTHIDGDSFCQSIANEIGIPKERILEFHIQQIENIGD